MNWLKIRIPLLIIYSLFQGLAGLALASETAPPRSVRSTDKETIEKLRQMHLQAENQILANNFRGAIDTYWEIIFLEPDDEEAYTGMGQAYLILGNYKKAHDAFENALRINPKSPLAMLGIQKIMDPDGVEGMVTNSQAEGADPVLAAYEGRKNS